MRIYREFRHIFVARFRDALLVGVGLVLFTFSFYYFFFPFFPIPTSPPSAPLLAHTICQSTARAALRLRLHSPISLCFIALPRTFARVFILFRDSCFFFFFFSLETKSRYIVSVGELVRSSRIAVSLSRVRLSLLPMDSIFFSSLFSRLSLHFDGLFRRKKRKSGSADRSPGFQRVAGSRQFATYNSTYGSVAAGGSKGRYRAAWTVPSRAHSLSNLLATIRTRLSPDCVTELTAHRETKRPLPSERCIQTGETMYIHRDGNGRNPSPPSVRCLPDRATSFQFGYELKHKFQSSGPAGALMRLTPDEPAILIIFRCLRAGSWWNVTVIQRQLYMRSTFFSFRIMFPNYFHNCILQFNSQKL